MKTKILTFSDEQISFNESKTPSTIKLSHTIENQILPLSETEKVSILDKEENKPEGYQTTILSPIRKIKYSTDFKLMLIKEAKTTSLKTLGKKYNISFSTLWNWTKQNKNTLSKKRKIYTTEFKKKVVNEYKRSFQVMKRVADKYNISQQTLSRWLTMNDFTEVKYQRRYISIELKKKIIDEYEKNPSKEVLVKYKIDKSDIKNWKIQVKLREDFDAKVLNWYKEKKEKNIIITTKEFEEVVNKYYYMQREKPCQRVYQEIRDRLNLEIEDVLID